MALVSKGPFHVLVLLTIDSFSYLTNRERVANVKLFRLTSRCWCHLDLSQKPTITFSSTSTKPIFRAHIRCNSCRLKRVYTRKMVMFMLILFGSVENHPIFFSYCCIFFSLFFRFIDSSYEKNTVHHSSLIMFLKSTK